MKKSYLVVEHVEFNTNADMPEDNKFPLAIFDTKGQANAYAKKYSKSAIYNSSSVSSFEPPLHYGKLSVEPIAHNPNKSASKLSTYQSKHTLNN